MWRHIARRWRDDERGNATLEFTIMVPLMMFFIYAGVELGLVTLRHTMMERALDLTVRDIRLGTGTAPQHDDIKDLICQRTVVISDCDANLRLEMIILDVRDWAAPPAEVDCIDKSRDVVPVRSFVPGLDNELMLLRVCLKFKPIFPNVGQAQYLERDAAGYARLVSQAAFVQEPR